MGKYKQWLHHQEVGRRLREQIATHEQERERVQRMAPSHPTTLPDTNNPLVRALLDYTGRGGTLGRAIGARLAGSATGGDAASQPRQPAGFTEAARPSAPSAALAGSPPSPPQVRATPALNTADNPIVAQLNAQAAQMPADPLDAMRALAQQQARDAKAQPPASPATGAPSPSQQPPAPEADGTGEWWQRFRSQS
jgi:hypothetical protein